MKKADKINDRQSKNLSLQETRDSEALVNEQYIKLQELVKNPTTIGFLEFLTGIAATAVEKPANLILSAGHLTQALFRGSFYKQLYYEIHDYRDKGKTSDEKLNSSYGKNIFVELMYIIDNEEDLDEERFRALKSIFLKSILKDTDEHTQMLAYQYFQVCKKLSSIDTLVLKTAYAIYEEPGSNQRFGGYHEWDVQIADKLGVPLELISQSRLENSGINSNPNTLIFNSNMDKNRHGLTPLGIAIGKFIKDSD